MQKGKNGIHIASIRTLIKLFYRNFLNIVNQHWNCPLKQISKQITVKYKYYTKQFGKNMHEWVFQRRSQSIWYQITHEYTRVAPSKLKKWEKMKRGELGFITTIARSITILLKSISITILSWMESSRLCLWINSNTPSYFNLQRNKIVF